LRGANFRSRSYRDPYAVVAGWSARVGVDLERLDAGLDRGFGEAIATPDERCRFGAQLDDPAFLTVLWSAKEALAKCLGDAVDYDPRRLDSPLLWGEGPLRRAGRMRAVRLEPPAGYVGWLVWEREP
jgi:hypothetical protein